MHELFNESRLYKVWRGAVMSIRLDSGHAVKSTAHQNSYFSKTINDWNSLPLDLIEVADGDIFRTGLQSLL